jgi:hypothetical protein
MLSVVGFNSGNVSNVYGKRHPHLDVKSTIIQQSMRRWSPPLDACVLMTPTTFLSGRSQRGQDTLGWRRWFHRLNSSIRGEWIRPAVG